MTDTEKTQMLTQADEGRIIESDRNVAGIRLAHYFSPKLGHRMELCIHVDAAKKLFGKSHPAEMPRLEIHWMHYDREGGLSVVFAVNPVTGQRLSWRSEARKYVRTQFAIDKFSAASSLPPFGITPAQTTVKNGVIRSIVTEFRAPNKYNKSSGGRKTPSRVPFSETLRQAASQNVAAVDQEQVRKNGSLSLRIRGDGLNLEYRITPERIGPVLMAALNKSAD